MFLQAQDHIRVTLSFLVFQSSRPSGVVISGWFFLSPSRMGGGGGGAGETLDGPNRGGRNNGGGGGGRCTCEDTLTINSV